MENMTVCEAGKLFGRESGLSTNPTVDEIRKGINEWLKEFRANVLQDMEDLITQTAGTPREAFWREMREKYQTEIKELNRDIAGLN